MNSDASIRNDFPILTEKIYGRSLVYFDNAATTQKPQCVLNKILEAYTKYNANIHRGVHYLSQMATEAHEAARQTVADFLGANDKKEIIFTRGTTEAINLVAFSFGENFVNEGDEIVVSAMEHHSNLVPWQMLCDRKKAKLRIIPVSAEGELDIEAYKNLLSEKTRLVSVTHVSNVLGTINPVQEIIRLAHKKNIPVLIDGAQSVPHLPVNVTALDADFFVFSGHKIYGPTGVGVLYGKAKWLEQMPPYQGGGEMIAHVSFEHTTYNDLPYKFEAGTPDYIGSTALAEALRYVEQVGFEHIVAHEQQLIEYATQQLRTIKDMRLIGEAAQKSGVISFLVGNIHPYDLGLLLDKQGVAVRTGHHCAQPLIDYFQIPGTVRLSFGLYNTINEIDNFMLALNRAVEMLR